MDIKEVEKLIDLYWEGATSVDEEKMICSFFSSHEHLPVELEKWRNWFEGRNAVCAMELDDSFDDTILAYAKRSTSAPKAKRFRLRHAAWTAIASAAMIGLIYFSWIKISEPAVVADLEISAEQQKEYEIVKELLFFTSSKINQTEIILDENLNKIDVINTYIN